MNLTNKLSLFSITCLIASGLFACSDDNKNNDEEPDFAKIEDVALAQTINGVNTFNLTQTDVELTYSTQMSIGDKPIDWTAPIFEQTFNNVEEIQEDKITVTTDQGAKVETVTINVVDNNIKVTFLKASNTFNYMSGAKFKLNVVTKLKESVTAADLELLKEKGFSCQSVFYIDGKKEEQAKSNIVTVFPLLEEEVIEEAVGDPRNSEYKYQLNVVYFMPSDVQENAMYCERISKILFEHQLFIRKWMKDWGYEEKSYGLDLNKDGLVNIIAVKGKEAKVGYPYNGSASKIKGEINSHFAANGLTFKSEHTLVITAVNEDLASGVKVPDTPFYGSGRWCYALDYPGMSQEAMGLGTASSRVATVWIGGMLHELGHGLNQPHVGPTKPQSVDPNFGNALMGSGNRTYGLSPTFMHETSAAIMNTCQISSFEPKTYYDTSTASVKISDVLIDGDKCTVKGNFTSLKPVTDVIVRFHNETETHTQSDGGYTSVAYYVKPNADNTFEKTFSISDLKVNSFRYKMGVTILLENGNNAKATRLDIYSQENNTLVSTSLNPARWTVTASHAMPQGAVDNNNPGNLVDQDTKTLLALVKPGKTHEGLSVPIDDQVFVVIDMKEQLSFNTVSLGFRTTDSRDWFRANKVSFYGSNNGTDFEIIKENNVLDVAASKSNATVNLGKTVTWQYLKMTYDAWHETANTMQFSELGLQNK